MVVYLRLALAYFCQFAIWGGWAIALGGYASGVLNFSGPEIGWLYAAIPLGAIIAPLFIGPIADRYFAAQKVLFVLHLIGGLALLGCGLHCWMSDSPSFLIIMGLMVLSGICFMPSIGLMNSVVFKHLPSASMAPYVFVFGTIGWIIINLFIAAFCGGSSTPYFFFVAGAVGVFLAVYSLTLPDTPPKGAPVAGEKSSGPGLLSMFKSFPFAIFVLCAFLASIPTSNFFFPALDTFLTERGYPSPLALGTLNQISEIAFMLALPFCIAKFGLKKVLLIGMAAWIVRYVLFAEPMFALTILGLLLHGFCYTFLFVASYMYAEKVAPAHLKASAQTMMVFLLLGVGQILGSLGYGYVSDANPPKFGDAEIAIGGAQLELAEGARLPEGTDVSDSFMVPVPAWSAGERSLFQYLDLAAQVNKLLGRTQDARTVDLGRLLGEQPLSLATIDAMPGEQLVQDNVRIRRVEPCCDTDVAQEVEPITASVRYTRDDLKQLGRAVAGKNVDGVEDFSLTREDWLTTRAHNWTQIWRLPALFIAVWFVVFFLLGRDPKDEGNASG